MSAADSNACEFSPDAILTAEERARFHDPAVMKTILGESRVVAVVGLSRDPAKPSHYVPAYLQGHGYRILPVNPNECTVLGERSVPDLAHLRERADLVLVFRPGAECLRVAREAAAAGIPRIWFQLNIPAGAGARAAAQAGMQVVMDACAMVEHRRLGL